jgi:hypothetical protein
MLDASNTKEVHMYIGCTCMLDVFVFSRCRARVIGRSASETAGIPQTTLTRTGGAWNI